MWLTPYSDSWSVKTDCPYKMKHMNNILSVKYDSYVYSRVGHTTSCGRPPMPALGKDQKKKILDLELGRRHYLYNASVCAKLLAQSQGVNLRTFCCWTGEPGSERFMRIKNILNSAYNRVFRSQREDHNWNRFSELPHEASHWFSELCYCSRDILAKEDVYYPHFSGLF